MFTGKNLNRLLEKGARDFIRSPRGVSRQGNALTISSIFDWYREDFVSPGVTLQDFLAKYATSPLREELKSFQGKITYQYDWSLNGLGSVNALKSNAFPSNT